MDLQEVIFLFVINIPFIKGKIHVVYKMIVQLI